MKTATGLVTRLGVLVVVQLAVVGVAVAPRLSAHVLGEDYRLRVAPVDPVDPFRGAYVALDYPDLRPDGRAPYGEVFVRLVPRGDLWTAGEITRARPAEPPYLACENDSGWRLRCGIESFFADQAEALRLEEEVGHGGAVATLRVDDRGNAAVVAIE